MLQGKASALPTGGTPNTTVNIHNHIIVGHDGKIYKGTQSKKLPNITPKRKATTQNSPEPSPTRVTDLPNMQQPLRD